jgi:hypothetical protein
MHIQQDNNVGSPVSTNPPGSLPATSIAPNVPLHSLIGATGSALSILSGGTYTIRVDPT